MTAYAVINPGSLAPGQPEDISVVLSNFNAIAAIINALDNTNIAPGAAIAYAKLALTGQIVNGDIAPGAAISASKIAGLPAGVTFLRKTTPKAVNTTVAATDLLNGEFTVPILAATNVVRLTAWGDYVNTAAANQAPPRFQLVLGGTTILDTGNTGAGNIQSSATRLGWRIDALIANNGVTNAQYAYLNLSGGALVGTGWSSGGAWTTGEGVYGIGTVTGAMGLIWANGLGQSAVDTSVARLLALNVINGNAGATYETKLNGAVAEILPS
jgi:hypothetical protein